MATQMPPDIAVFATAVAAGATVRDASRLAGFSERTGYRRLAEVVVRKELALKKAELCEQAAARLQLACLRATAKVEELMDDKDPKVRLAACKAAVAMSKEMREEAERQAALARNMAPGMTIDAAGLEERLEAGQTDLAALVSSGLYEPSHVALERLQAEGMLSLGPEVIDAP